MRGSFILSFILHVAFVAIVWFGPPSFDDPIMDPVQVIDVAIITEFKQRPDESKTEKPVPKPKEKPPKPPKPTKTASLPKPPPPPPAPPSPPEPVAKPEPKEEIVPIPKEKPASVPIPKKEPKPEPKPEKVEQPKQVMAPRPRRKPKPPPEDDFASVLKTVEKLKTRAKPDPKPKKKEPSFEDELSDVLNKHARVEPPSQPAPLGPKMSMSEIDALRRQIERCWNPPAGAPKAENLVVEVKLAINPDGTVQRAQIVDTARMSRDPFYRAAAESVRRAIKSPLCTPLRLPLEKFELWKDTTLRFDPKELVGR
jgi:hypothetical protein